MKALQKFEPVKSKIKTTFKKLPLWAAQKLIHVLSYSKICVMTNKKTNKKIWNFV